MGTNTTKIFDLPEGTFGVDLPKDDEDDDEVESVSEEEEEHLPQTGTTSHAAAQSDDITKFSIPAKSPSITHKQPAPKIKGQSKQQKDEGPEAEWEFEIEPLNKAEVHYPENGISYLKTVVPKDLSVNESNREVRECMNVAISFPLNVNIQQKPWHGDHSNSTCPYGYLCGVWILSQ